jgi:hypothetical protein
MTQVTHRMRGLSEKDVEESYLSLARETTLVHRGGPLSEPSPVLNCMRYYFFVTRCLMNYVLL